MAKALVTTRHVLDENTVEVTAEYFGPDVVGGPIGVDVPVNAGPLASDITFPTKARNAVVDQGQAMGLSITSEDVLYL